MGSGAAAGTNFWVVTVEMKKKRFTKTMNSFRNEFYLLQILENANKKSLAKNLQSNSVLHDQL